MMIDANINTRMSLLNRTDLLILNFYTWTMDFDLLFSQIKGFI